MAALVPAHAEGLKGVVVTATRSEVPIAESLADVTLIDAEVIARSGARSLAELLRSEAGIEISQSGSEVGLTGVFVRGTKTSQSVVLVDGVRIENPASGVSQLEYIPLSAIERVEIVRGPLSSLYGSGAMGGVIQIFTRQGSGAPRPFLTAGLGSLGTQRLQAGFGGSNGEEGRRTRFSVALAVDRTLGFEATQPKWARYQEDRDGNVRRSATASLTQDLGSDWQAGANFLIGSGRAKYDSQYSTTETSRFDYRSSALSAFLRGRVSRDWQTELRIGETQLGDTYDDFGYAPRIASVTQGWQNTFSLPQGRLLFGVEQLRQRISGDGVTTGPDPYLVNTRRTDSAYAGYEVGIDRHQLRVQLRRDRIGGIGAQPSLTAAWGYRIAPTWQLRVAYGEAFRAPTFDDLYYPYGSNPDLRPERSRSAEVGVEHRSAEALFKATAFASRIRDAIELDANYIPNNLDSARVRGVSLEARRRMGAFTLRGTLTLQDPQGERFDSITNEVVSGPLARRARRLATAGIDWQPAAWRLGVEWLGQGGRVDSNGASMSGYGVLSASATWPVQRGLDLFARLDNLTDRRYETTWGYNMPPRTVFVGLRYQPN